MGEHRLLRGDAGADGVGEMQSVLRQMHDVHSVRERLSVPSTERVYELVCEVLRRSR